MPQFNLSTNNFKDMWSYYLFGKSNFSAPKGDDLLDESIIKNNIVKNSQTDYKHDPLTISSKEFMETGAGRFVNGANFGVINRFFHYEKHGTVKVYDTFTYADVKNYIQSSGKGTVKANGDVELNLGEMLSRNEQMLGFSGNTPTKSISISQRQFAPKTESNLDFAKRVQLFESTNFQLGSNTKTGQFDKDMKFVIHPDGTREILNFVIVPSEDDNFDFVGGNGEGMQAAGNQLSEFISDPSSVRYNGGNKTYGIGRTVPIKYIDPQKVNVIKKYTVKKFEAHQKALEDNNFIDIKSLEWTSPIDSHVLAIRTLNVLLGTFEIYQKLYDEDIISFKDGEGRTVYYGTHEADVLDLDEFPVQSYKIKTILDTIALLHPTLAAKVAFIKTQISLPNEGNDALNSIEETRLDNFATENSEQITFVAGGGDDIIKGLLCTRQKLENLIKTMA